MAFIHLPIEQIRSALIRQGFEYWQTILRGRTIPLLEDFDPGDIPALQPYVTVSEIHRDPLRVRYRMVGPRIRKIDGWDKRGHWMDEEPWLEDYQQWVIDYDTVLQTKLPLFGRDHLIGADGEPVMFEWALMPLGGQDGEVKLSFEIEIFDDEPALLDKPLIERTGPVIAAGPSDR